jgi:hypothetical protein
MRVLRKSKRRSPKSESKKEHLYQSTCEYEGKESA